MKKIIFLMLVVSLGLFSCKSNFTSIGDKNANYIPYYLKVYEADSLYLLGNYKQSYEILDSLFKKFEPINMPVYFEYEQYIKLAYNFNRQTKKDIRKLSECYNYNLMDLKNDSILQLALNGSKIKEKKNKQITYSI